MVITIERVNFPMKNGDLVDLSLVMLVITTGYQSWTHGGSLRRKPAIRPTESQGLQVIARGSNVDVETRDQHAVAIPPGECGQQI